VEVELLGVVVPLELKLQQAKLLPLLLFNINSKIIRSQASPQMEGVFSNPRYLLHHKWNK
jgi:hypothetical protein